MKIILLVSTMAICSGCLWDRNGDGVLRVACVGDSNTQASGDPDIQMNWCELLAAQHPAVQWVNVAIWGTTATRTGLGAWCGVDQVAKALRYYPDLIVIALGTNDLLHLGLDPQTVADTLMALQDQAEAGGATGVVALIPPVLNDDGDLEMRITEANDLLAAALVPLVEFHSGLEVSDFTPEGVHFTQSGQDKRAAAANAVIFAR